MVRGSYVIVANPARSCVFVEDLLLSTIIPVVVLEFFWPQSTKAPCPMWGRRLLVRGTASISGSLAGGLLWGLSFALSSS